MTDTILRSLARDHWKKIGVRHHHGINIPLFSIYSKNSTGVGEYSDLIPLITWCKEIGYDILQLLPLNDTGGQNSPYNAISAFALNPLHLSLARLPTIDKTAIKELKALCGTPRVNDRLIKAKKEALLRTYFARVKEEITSSTPYKEFVEKNPWLEPYALFKAKKIEKNWTPWHSWPSFKKEPYKNEVAFHTFVQFLCFEEMKQVKAHAQKERIFIKGDIPILISCESADVWQNPSLFNLHYTAGAPPDMFAKDGQNWGFPIYHWKTHQKDNYAWWKMRLDVANNFYDLFRLDHIVGFFRIFAIPEGQDTSHGIYIPENPHAMQKQGKEILEMMLTQSSMLPIGEDLGTVSDEVRGTLRSLGIPGTKVIRWERKWKTDESYIPLDHYIPESMATVSTHDMEPLQLWWEKYPEEAKPFSKMLGWSYKKPLTHSKLFELLYDSHHTTSLLHINLLQEYLQLIPTMSEQDLESCRINVPSTFSTTNWSHRIRTPVEAITSNSLLKKLMKECIR